MQYLEKFQPVLNPETASKAFLLYRDLQDSILSSSNELNHYDYLQMQDVIPSLDSPTMAPPLKKIKRFEESFSMDIAGRGRGIELGGGG